MDQSWKEVLGDEFTKPYFVELEKFVEGEYADSQKAIYPETMRIFRAFELCPFDEVKVVILGQDPYHGEGQAHGLCFSVSNEVVRPPSLVNIFKEVASDLRIKPQPSSNLERWAAQGVLLLNATLTVEAGKPGSHQRKGWEQFTDRVIQELSEKRSGLVFILWGRYAQQKGEKINTTKHLVLKAKHPSPLSAHHGFFGCKHFSKTNAYLVKADLKPIDWS